MLDAPVQQNAEEEQARPAHTADIVLGLLSYKSADTAANAERIARESLTAFFPSKYGVIVKAEGGSKDGVPEAAASAEEHEDLVRITYPVFPAQKILPEYYGVPGKTNAVQAVFSVANSLNAT